MAASLGVPAGAIGRTGGSALVVTDHFEIPLDELGAAWRGTLRAAFGELTRPLRSANSPGWTGEHASVADGCPSASLGTAWQPPAGLGR